MPKVNGKYRTYILENFGNDEVKAYLNFDTQDKERYCAYLHKYMTNKAGKTNRGQGLRKPSEWITSKYFKANSNAYMDFDEIARALHLSKHSVVKYYQSAMYKLKEKINTKMIKEYYE